MPKQTTEPTVLDQAVTQAEDGTWGFQCPGIVGSPCGDVGVPFSSTGWPGREHAHARGRQHLDEHKGLGVMPELDQFRTEHGLTVVDGAAVKVEDI